MPHRYAQQYIPRMSPPLRCTCWLLLLHFGWMGTQMTPLPPHTLVQSRNPSTRTPVVCSVHMQGQAVTHSSRDAMQSTHTHPHTHPHCIDMHPHTSPHTSPLYRHAPTRIPTHIPTQHTNSLGTITPILDIVFNSVKYAPPIDGSLIFVYKLPMAVNINVDVKLVTSPNTASIAKSLGCCCSDSAPSGKRATRAVVPTAVTRRRRYPSSQGLEGVPVVAQRPARKAETSSQGNSRSTRPASASLETPFSNNLRGAAWMWRGGEW